MEYEEKLRQCTDKQLIFERAILLKQHSTTKKQLALLDEECKKRLDVNIK